MLEMDFGANGSPRIAFGSLSMISGAESNAKNGLSNFFNSGGIDQILGNEFNKLD